MSLMSTLAKVAVGVAVAKGVSGMVKQSSASNQSQSGGLGGLLGGALGGGQQQQASGGLEGMLGSLLGGGQGSASQGNGLGGLLEQISGGVSGQNTASGGLNGILGGLAGNAGGAAGGLAGALGGLLGAGGAAAAIKRATSGQPEQSFGDMLNQAIAKQDEPPVPPTAEQEALAGLMLSAMIQAMKSDGHIDKAEEAKLMGRLGDIDDDEREFVMQEMKKPVDVDALVNAVPKGLEAQIYTMSVMGIDLDSQEEAKYLNDLANGLGLNAQAVNQIHEQLGVPSLYS